MLKASGFSVNFGQYFFWITPEALLFTAWGRFMPLVACHHSSENIGGISNSRSFFQTSSIKFTGAFEIWTHRAFESCRLIKLFGHWSFWACYFLGKNLLQPRLSYFAILTSHYQALFWRRLDFLPPTLSAIVYQCCWCLYCGWHFILKKGIESMGLLFLGLFFSVLFYAKSTVCFSVVPFTVDYLLVKD